jgi:CheY-like chemotaxis protein
VVLLDLMMPKVNGWELLGRLEPNDPPVILISGYPEAEWLEDPHVQACFSKPIDTYGLLSTLRASSP